MADDLSLFHEIDESLRADRLQQFWKRFGNMVVAGCSLVLVLTIASVVWKNHLHEVHMRETATLLKAQALEDAGSHQDAAALLAPLAGSDSSLASIAGIKRAQILVNAGKNDEALAQYATVVHTASDQALKDYAALQAHLLIEPGKNTDIASPTGAYALSLQEVTAAGLINEGKTKEAAAMLKTIEDSEHAPASERTRAAELREGLGKKP